MVSPAGASPVSPQSQAQSAGTTSWGAEDMRIGQEKIEQLMPMIKEAAKKYNIDPKMLAAIILQEGRGLTVEQLGSAAGVAQIGQLEVDHVLGDDPEYDGNHLSPRNQIFGAAAYLQQLGAGPSGSPDNEQAVRMYNGGPNSTKPDGLNDPAYMEKHAQALEILEGFDFDFDSLE